MADAPQRVLVIGAGAYQTSLAVHAARAWSLSRRRIARRRTFRRIAEKRRLERRGEDIVGARWLKCAWNTVFNPISVLGRGLGTRDILADESAARFVRETIAETCAIAATSGHPLPADTVEKQIAGMLRMPNYVSSMRQDYLAGRPMETEALLGNAVRIAERLGVAIPRLDALRARPHDRDEERRAVRIVCVRFGSELMMVAALLRRPDCQAVQRRRPRVHAA